MTKRTFLGAALGALPLLTRNRLNAQSPPENEAPALATGAIAAHVAGRMILNIDGTLDVIQYFLWVDGLGADVFAGAPSERTAHFTLRADRLRPIMIQNGDVTHISFQPAGSEGLYRVFYDPSPVNRDFSRPETFSSGTQIAAFKSRRTQATLIEGSHVMVTGTADVVDATEITFREKPIAVSALYKVSTFLFHVRAFSPADFGITTISLPYGGHIAKAG
jgi:hypothetical protein